MKNNGGMNHGVKGRQDKYNLRLSITLTLDDEPSIRPPGNQQHNTTQYSKATKIQSRTFGIFGKEYVLA